MQRMRLKRRFVKIVLIAAILVMGSGINVSHANLADSAISAAFAIWSQSFSQMDSSLALYYGSTSYLYSAYLNMEDAYWYADDAWYYAYWTASGTYAYYAYTFAGYARAYYDDASYFAWLAYVYSNSSYTALSLYFGAIGDYYCAAAEIYAAWGS